MVFKLLPTCASTICYLLLSAHLVRSHMEMSWPYPLRSKFNKDNSYGTVDYSMTSPLQGDGSDYPCKGYHLDRPRQATATYTAGSTYNISLAGSATHNGGSCQLSLSYDEGASFRVIKSMIGACPLSESYDFTVPLDAPAGEAVLLAWTWQNQAGNREFYMNCAEVNVVSTSSRRHRRRRDSAFEALPGIWKANMKSINDCATVEGDDPVYPNPGSSVEYANGLSSSSPATPGECETGTPTGDPDEDETPEPSTSATTNATASSTATTEPSKSPEVSSDGRQDDSMTDIYNYPQADATRSVSDDSATEIYIRSPLPSPTQTLLAALKNKAVLVEPRSTVTVTADCESTVTVTLGQDAMGSKTLSMATTTRRQETTAAVALPTGVRPLYATGDPNAFLPCVAGTFLCTSSTSFLTCDYNDGTVDTEETYAYSPRSLRQVAEGMECLPYLAPFSGITEPYADSGSSWGYRDDRYIRARPEGDCDADGEVRCTYGGQQFSICDHGGWVSMGSVAPGTVCSGGSIVAWV